MEDGLALGLAMYGVTKKEQIEERLALYEKIRRNRAASIQIMSNFGADEETPAELAGFLEGNPMPSKYLHTLFACKFWMRIDELCVESVSDVKAIAFGGDVMKKIVEEMKAFDPENWKIPEGFFPAGL